MGVVTDTILPAQIKCHGLLMKKLDLTESGKRAPDRSWKQHYSVLAGDKLLFYKDKKDALFVSSLRPFLCGHAHLLVCEIEVDNTISLSQFLFLSLNLFPLFSLSLSLFLLISSLSPCVINILSMYTIKFLFCFSFC